MKFLLNMNVPRGLGRRLASVVIFRLRNMHPDNLLARIVSAWSEIKEPLEQGAIVILEDATLRI